MRTKFVDEKNNVVNKVNYIFISSKAKNILYNSNSYNNAISATRILDVLTIQDSILTNCHR
jgi:hypothetical protein